MAWRDENGIILCSQITVDDLFVYKTCSGDRELYFNQITKILNTVKNLWLKAGQRSVCHRLHVLLKIFHL